MCIFCKIYNSNTKFPFCFSCYATRNMKCKHSVLLRISIRNRELNFLHSYFRIFKLFMVGAAIYSEKSLGKRKDSTLMLNRSCVANTHIEILNIIVQFSLVITFAKFDTPNKFRIYHVRTVPGKMQFYFYKSVLNDLKTFI